LYSIAERTGIEEQDVEKWQNLSIEHEDRVAVLIIDHPPVNCLSTAVLVELGAAIDQLLEDDATKAVIVTGAGAKVFVAGADIQEIRSLFDRPEDDYAAARAFIERGQALFLAIERATKPFIAAINGICVGGGLELAMACHLRVCSERAALGATEIRLGLLPGWGGTQRLARLTNRAKALELILTGDMIGAQEAYRIGLVNKAVPRDEVLKEARALAGSIVSKSGFATMGALRAVSGGLDVSLEEGLAIEAQQFVLLGDKQDPREGLDAFLEKRQPRFADR
jgi:enoyl-CoA hydratase/carnithine racemase